MGRGVCRDGVRGTREPTAPARGRTGAERFQAGESEDGRAFPPEQPVRIPVLGRGAPFTGLAGLTGM